MSHASVIAFASLVSGCKQYRTVPVSEATKLSWDNVPPSGVVVVKDIDGETVRIDSFRYVDVPVIRCNPVPNSHDRYCYADEERFVAPVQLEVAGGSLLAIPNPRDRRQDRPKRFDGIDRVTIVDKSSKRTWIMISTAVVVGGIAGLGTTYLLTKFDPNDPHGERAFILGAVVGQVAAGASLLITGPLTYDLGEPVK